MTINCKSLVARMIALNVPPVFARYGVPLEIQPRVQLHGIDGGPIAGMAANDV